MSLPGLQFLAGEAELQSLGKPHEKVRKYYVLSMRAHGLIALDIPVCTRRRTRASSCDAL